LEGNRLKAVIQAGGRGTRLYDITKDEIPKPMIPILGKPLLEWQIEKCKEKEISEIIIIIGHLGNKIKDYFQDGVLWDVSITYIEEEEPLGTAGAFYFLKEMIEEEAFLLFYGDVFWDINVERMLEFHKRKKSKFTLFVHPNSHPYDSDVIIKDDDERIVGIDSKHNIRNYWYDNLVNAGLYIIEDSVCKNINELRKIDLEKDIINQMIECEEEIYGYRSSEYIKDAGTVERLSAVEKDVESGYTVARNLRKEQKCIFLDRDGTINVKNGFVDSEDKFFLEKDVIEAIKKINNSEYLALLVTNQPVVARGLCTMDEVKRIHQKMTSILGEGGAYLDDIAFCPHHPDKGFPEERIEYKIECMCRKPQTGLLTRFAEKYHINLEQSWIVGDTNCDMQTGNNAGTHTALVLTGDAGKDIKYQPKIELVCENLLQAVEKILGER